MDLMRSFGVLRKRWILTSVLLLLTLMGSAAAFLKLPWSYQAVGTEVLLNSKSASAGSDNNPLLAFDPSLASTAEVLSLAVMSPQAAQSLKARGYSAGYQVAVTSATGGPILQVTVTGSNKVVVESTLHGVMSEISVQLQNLQSGLAAKNLIRELPLSETPQATRSTSKKAKPLVAVLGLGLVLTFVIPQIIDGLANRGSSRDDESAPRLRTLGEQPLPGRRGERYLDEEAPVYSRLRRRPESRTAFMPRRDDDGVPVPTTGDRPNGSENK